MRERETPPHKNLVGERRRFSASRPGRKAPHFPDLETPGPPARDHPVYVLPPRAARPARRAAESLLTGGHDTSAVARTPQLRRIPPVRAAAPGRAICHHGQVPPVPASAT